MFVHGFHENCKAVMDNYNPTDVFILGGEAPDADQFRKLLIGDDKNLIPGSTDLIKTMVELWIQNANQYEANRVASAMTQLRNAGVSEEEIQSLIRDPLALRNFIHESREALLIKLNEIHRKIEEADPLNMATKDEIALFNKHKEWYMKKGQGDDDYYPNDAAVHYSALLMEIAALVTEQKVLPPGQVCDVVEHIFKVMHGAMTSQSVREGWSQLGTMADFEFSGVNCGSVIRQYVTDNTRCIEDGDKQSSPFGRSPLRVMRMACNFYGLNGAFSLLNATDKQFIAAAVKMFRDEQEIKELSRTAQFIKEGPEDFYVSISCCWLKVLERESLHYAIIGRNDLSVPKLVQNIVNMDMDAFDQLLPRDWALDADICGTNKDASEIDISKLRASVHWKQPPQEVVLDSTDASNVTTASSIVSSLVGKMDKLAIVSADGTPMSESATTDVLPGVSVQGARPKVVSPQTTLQKPLAPNAGKKPAPARPGQTQTVTKVTPSAANVSGQSPRRQRRNQKGKESNEEY